MRPFRLGRWGSPILPLGTRPQCSRLTQPLTYNLRWESHIAIERGSDLQPPKRKRGRPRKLAPLESNLAAAALSSSDPVAHLPSMSSPPFSSQNLAPEQHATPAAISQAVPLENMPSPPLAAARTSAKLAALHARLALPSRLPLETLARALVDQTADRDSRFNNVALAQLGNDLLGYYMSEHLLCHYPRIPMVVMFAAQFAYVGPTALASVARDWGVEVAAEPGGEVDSGLLQFKRAMPGFDSESFSQSTRKDTNRRGDKVEWRRGISSRIVYDDSFGDKQPASDAAKSQVSTVERASTHFIRALFGALYLHAGAASAQAFFKAHILSRHLDFSSLFTFTDPARDLSRLCAREGFESPVARLESESGRLSRHPVFVVGVYSGRDKLGEGAGPSLNEARFRAAVAALKGWYLYSPPGQIVLPSQMEGEAGAGRTFTPAMVDMGEVIA